MKTLVKTETQKGVFVECFYKGQKKSLGWIHQDRRIIGILPMGERSVLKRRELKDIIDALDKFNNMEFKIYKAKWTKRWFRKGK